MPSEPSVRSDRLSRRGSQGALFQRASGRFRGLAYAGGEIFVAKRRRDAGRSFESVEDHLQRPSLGRELKQGLVFDQDAL
jgi:hypothetical protein